MFSHTPKMSSPTSLQGYVYPRLKTTGTDNQITDCERALAALYPQKYA
jgi:hypothetical protein